MTKKQDTENKTAENEENLPDTIEEGGAPAIPDYMKEFMQQSQADTGSLIASSTSVPRLSYRGKRWRFIVDGEEELIKDLHVDVIVVGVEPDAGRFIKTYYANTYNPGDSSPPDCSSSNGIMPDAWVSNPQAQRCGQCMQNVFGSAVSRSGGKAKACHDSKRLWLTKADDTDVIYGLNVPIMSLKNLAEYGKFIARNNYPLTLVITRLTLDDEAEFPKLCFAHQGFVQEDLIKEAVSLNQRRPWKVPMPELPAGGAQPLRLPNQPAPTTPAANPIKPERKEGEVPIDKIIDDWD